MNPINCINCGCLFMRHGPPERDRKHCNNCQKKEVKVDEAKILITVSHAQQVEIEELCINEGLSISEYFMNLHEQNKNKKNNEHNDFSYSSESKEKNQKKIKK